MDEHFKETITLDQLEQQFLLNKYQLSKDFSKFIGSPPIIMNILKMKNENNHSRITEVAAVVYIEAETAVILLFYYIF